MYQDRVNELDSDTIAGWNDTINFLLIFVSNKLATTRKTALNAFNHTCISGWFILCSDDSVSH